MSHAPPPSATPPDPRAGEPAPPDAELLQAFLASRDSGAFESIVRRHGPMVLGVCQRVL